MLQLSLFDPIRRAARPRAPHSGAGTSEAAARGVEGDAAALRKAVLRFLLQRGSEGATDEEIQQGLGLRGDTQRPRRWELVGAGLVRDSGQRRPTASGRAAVVWVADAFQAVSCPGRSEETAACGACAACA